MKFLAPLLSGLLLAGCAQTWDDTRPNTPPGGTGLMADGQVASYPQFTASIPQQPAYNQQGTVQPFGPSGEIASYEFAQGYRIGTGDRLTIRVLGQQDLTGDYIVDASGNISIPLVRSLPVAGLSTAEIETQITERLKQGFLRNPSVSVQLAIARPFYIMGQVNQAGSFSYRPGMTAQNAIAMAGGFSPRADQTSVLVTRRLVNGTKTQRVPVTTQLHPGDVVFVRERWF
jgi:polysaccharide export outer membrane protein